MTEQERVDYLAGLVVGFAQGDEALVSVKWLSGFWDGPDRKVRVHSQEVVWEGTARDWREALARV
jgi:hypothetical protein